MLAHAARASATAARGLAAASRHTAAPSRRLAAATSAPAGDVHSRFARACEVDGPRIAASPDTALKLRAYGLYKQATVGDAPPGSAPGAFDFTGRAKHGAWAALAGTAREDAMAAYVALAAGLPGDGGAPAAPAAAAGGAAAPPPGRVNVSAAAAPTSAGASAFLPVMRAPMLPRGTFDGVLALVTGGGTGLGRAMATTLASLGATVCITSRKVSEGGGERERRRERQGGGGRLGQRMGQVRVGSGIDGCRAVTPPPPPLSWHAPPHSIRSAA
jgi:diazepam-binding inhibitor (GABA receptor modulator, acyl-CoA-binding protein)